MAASSPVRVKYLELICAYALVKANMRWANAPDAKFLLGSQTAHTSQEAVAARVGRVLFRYLHP